MTHRLRSFHVLTILLAGGLALIASTQTWIDVVLVDSAAEPLHVAGATAVPLLAPLSLAALALGLALSITGRAVRYAFGVVAVGIGVVLATSAVRIVVDRPLEAVAAAVTESTGLAGIDAVRTLVAEIVLTPWPAVTVAVAVLIAVGGAGTLATAHRWTGAGRRYRTDTASAAPGSRPHDAIDSWDDLSRGDDPTV